MESMFSEMDIDGKGSVMFSEWCQYLQQEERKFDTPMARLLDAGDGNQPMSKSEAMAGRAGGGGRGGASSKEPDGGRGAGTYDQYGGLFESVFKGLAGTGDEAKGLRKAAWRQGVDPNGNGYASLAEVRTTSTRTPHSSRTLIHSLHGLGVTSLSCRCDSPNTLCRCI